MANINDKVKKMYKYDPLLNYLVELPQDQVEVKLTFSEIENIISNTLPKSAYIYTAWWANEGVGRHVQAKAWMRAGWEVDTVDLADEWVRFVRMR
jgi:hypothetical protein